MIVVSQVLDFLGPRPGLAIVRVHQGKVEVALRIALIVKSIHTFLGTVVLATCIAVGPSVLHVHMRSFSPHPPEA